MVRVVVLCHPALPSFFFLFFLQKYLCDDLDIYRRRQIPWHHWLKCVNMNILFQNHNLTLSLYCEGHLLCGENKPRHTNIDVALSSLGWHAL